MSVTSSLNKIRLTIDITLKHKKKFKYVNDQKWILGSKLKMTYFLGIKNIFNPIIYYFILQIKKYYILWENSDEDIK